MYALGLSKSMQLESLLSYHLEDAAEPEPPKAFMFFLGVAGFDMCDKSVSTEQEDQSFIRRCVGR